MTTLSTAAEELLSAMEGGVIIRRCKPVIGATYFYRLNGKKVTAAAHELIAAKLVRVSREIGCYDDRDLVLVDPDEIKAIRERERAAERKKRIAAEAEATFALVLRVADEISRYDDFSDDAADEIVAAARAIIARVEKD